MCVNFIVEKIRNFDGGDARWLVDAYPDYPAYAAVLYLVIVFYLPGYLEKHNLKFKLKWTVALWNLFLSVVSFIGSFYTVKLLFELLFVSRGFYRATCEMLQPPGNSKLTNFTLRLHSRQFAEEKTTYDDAGTLTGGSSAVLQAYWDRFNRGPTAFFIAFFVYLKTPELLDTVFLILQAKPVSFLHWFHHIATAMHCWHSAYVLCSYGLFFVAMNYSVHAIMYFYYFLVTLGFRRTIRPVAPVITLLQVAQMYVGVGITIYAYLQYWLGPTHRDQLFYKFFAVLFSTTHYVKAQLANVVFSSSHSLLPHNEVPAYKMADHFYGCQVDRANLRMTAMMFTTYCVLFVTLFKELYLAKRHNKKVIVLACKNEES